VSRDELNKLVMNYLILEGHKEGALNFQKESGLQCDDMIDSDIIDARVQVKKLILAGELDQAIKALNELNPEVS
jgi:glucose-induced degradation protein 8